MKRLHRKIKVGDFAGLGQKLYQRLSESVVGQDEAVRAVVDAYQYRVAGMGDGAGQTAGNFLFLGPTGTGKTLLVQKTAEAISGLEEAVVRIDCGEFQHSHEIAKLIGSPPGYLGHRETPAMLRQEVLDRYITPDCQLCFVLFDEIEKASDALWNLLLGILDRAEMKTGNAQVVNFSKAMIFMTSNLGADMMQKFLRPGIGLAPGPTAEEIEKKLGSIGAEAARKKFTPEFMNRLDHIVTFKPLDRLAMAEILELEMAQLQNAIFNQVDQAHLHRSYMFAVSTAAREQILEQGFSPQYGARFLKRTIKRVLTQPLASMVCAGQIKAGELVQLDYHPERGFEFYKEFEGLNSLQMGWIYNVIYVKGIAVPKLKHLKELEVPAA